MTRMEGWASMRKALRKGQFGWGARLNGSLGARGETHRDAQRRWMFCDPGVGFNGRK